MAGSSRLDWGCLAMGQAGWAVGEGPCGAILDKSVPATFIRTGCFERILKLAGFLDQVFESLALSIVDHVAAYLRLGSCVRHPVVDPGRRRSWGRSGGRRSCFHASWRIDSGLVRCGRGVAII